MVKIKKETENTWEYKVGNNANIAIFVRLWKPRIAGKVPKQDFSHDLTVSADLIFTVSCPR